MKTRKLTYCLVIIFSILCLSCAKEEGIKQVEQIKFDVETLNLILDGQTGLINATVLPKDAPDKKIKWQSTDNTVAMSNDGLVTAYSVGECDIIATSTNGIQSKCHVIVTDAPLELSSIIVEYDNYAISKGDNLLVKVKVFPLLYTNDDLDVKISDESILSMSKGAKEFNFIALAAGETEITFTSKENSEIKATCKVEVRGETVMTDEKDGKEYKIAQIGNRIWMTENYAFLGNEEHQILAPLDDTDHKSISTPYCYVYGYDGSSVSEAKDLEKYKEFGAFYNYPAAESLAPEGWRLPNEEDWIDLQKFIGMTDEQIEPTGGYMTRGTVSGKLKMAGTWLYSWDGSEVEDDANNLSGWSGKAAGLSYDDNVDPMEIKWNSINTAAYWWSTQESMNGYPDTHVFYGLISGFTFVYKSDWSGDDFHALNVRYVKDVE